MRTIALLSPSWRLVTAVLVAASLATLPTYLIAWFVLPPIPPTVMVRSFVLGTALPALMAWAVERTFAGTADVHDGVLRLRRSDLELSIPCASIVAARPWWASLPRPGLTLRLRSGERVPIGVALDHPNLLLDVLALGGVDVRAARRHPCVVHAATRRPWRFGGLLLKFAVFGLVPSAILFYTHQHIAYGGTFGQYYLEGPGPYLRTFWEYWSNVAILLISWASFWRAAGEATVWMTAAIAAERTLVARRIVEAACGLAYYGGVPALLALRYAA